MIPFVDQFGRGALRPRRPLIDPAAQQGNLIGAQSFTFFWHDQIRFETADRLNEEAFGAFAGNDSGAEFAAFQGNLLGIQSEQGFLFVRSMTVVTMTRKD